MLMMPTGNPGIMYKPKYFHEVVFSPEFRNATVTTDDLMFRLCGMMKNIPVLLGCGGAENRYQSNHPPGLHSTVHSDDHSHNHHNSHHHNLSSVPAVPAQCLPIHCGKSTAGAAATM